jgi:hypothetical protein
MGVMMGVILHNETRCMDFVRFEHGRQSVFVEFFTAWYSVVPNHGSGECNNLEEEYLIGRY